MNEAPALQDATIRPQERKVWEPPAIVLERSLLVSAQDPVPGERRAARTRPNGLIGPLSASGGGGQCL